MEAERLYVDRRVKSHLPCSLCPLSDIASAKLHTHLNNYVDVDVDVDVERALLYAHR